MKRGILIVLMLALSLLSTCAEGDSWICSQCGTENSGNFCGNCGSPRDSWICPSCGQSNTTNFCTNCGQSKPANDVPASAEAEHAEAISGTGTEQSLDDAIYYDVLAAKEGNEDAVERLKALGINITVDASNEEYYNSDRAWVDIAMSDVSVAFSDAGDGALYDYCYEADNRLIYSTRDRRLVITAFSDDQWNEVHGFMVSTSDVDLYLRALDALCDIAWVNERQKLLDLNKTISAWLTEKAPSIIECGRKAVGNLWQVYLDGGGLIRITVDKAEYGASMEAVLYLDERYVDQ